MSTGPTQRLAIPDAAVLRTRPVPPWSRPLAVATAAIFCVSAAFPVVAGLSKDTGAFPKSWGITDVVLAFVLAAMVFTVMVAAHGKVSRQADDATYHAYRILTHGIFVMLSVLPSRGTDNTDVREGLSSVRIDRFLVQGQQLNWRSPRHPPTRSG